MIYGELWLFPIEIDVKLRIISYWARLLTGKETKLSYLSYKILYNLFIDENLDFSWIKHMWICLQHKHNINEVFLFFFLSLCVFSAKQEKCSLSISKTKTKNFILKYTIHYNGIEKLHIKIQHNTYMTNKKQIHKYLYIQYLHYNRRS
jgi:hypothetical protein